MAKIEIRIMDKAKEETGQLSRKKNYKFRDKQTKKDNTPEVRTRQENQIGVLLKAVITIIHHERA